MQHIHYLSQTKVNYYIYKLNKKDSIIKLNHNHTDNTLIILQGIIHLKQTFRHKEDLSIAILNAGHIIKSQKYKNNNYYYQITALEKTYVISFNNQELYKNIDMQLIKYIINSYILTLDRYESINYIIKHKYSKDRFIQLIFFLCQEFGKIQRNKITFYLFLTKKQISIIIGCNTNRINDIIQSLNPYLKIYKNKKIVILTSLFSSITTELNNNHK